MVKEIVVKKKQKKQNNNPEKCWIKQNKMNLFLTGLMGPFEVLMCCRNAQRGSIVNSSSQTHACLRVLGREHLLWPWVYSVHSCRLPPPMVVSGHFHCAWFLGCWSAWKCAWLRIPNSQRKRGKWEEEAYLRVRGCILFQSVFHCRGHMPVGSEFVQLTREEQGVRWASG